MTYINIRKSMSHLCTRELLFDKSRSPQATSVFVTVDALELLCGFCKRLWEGQNTLKNMIQIMRNEHLAQTNTSIRIS